MATSRLHTHPLPAPVIHAGFSVSQSKSHVLAGVQDAYWSDDEAEDAECPLCLEEMDISDLNFKPCICGYQICRFCWHHIKENLNKRCPACRRVYTDDAIEFKPIATQDHKRLTQQKKQRERERKELDALGRRPLANVRVVQRNVVYVVGIGPRFAKEELIPTLRSNEYFGQYGKINKILLVKRTPSGGGAPVVGLYITYHRREDAARCITAVDGTASPGGGREPMRASYGTTKYCMTFLRGLTCSDHGCMNLHEWGDEKDCFTKEDLTTLKHTMKATESRSRNVVPAHKKGDDQDALPRGAAWAQKPNVQQSTTSSVNTVRQTRRGGAARQLARHSTVAAAGTSTYSRTERKTVPAAKPPSQTSSSRPVTPAPPGAPQQAISPTDTKTVQKKERGQVPSLPLSSPSVHPDPEEASGSQAEDVVPPTVQQESTDLAQSPVLSTPTAPSGFPSAPPGLAAPLGIAPGRPPRVQTASPQTPLLAFQSSYQMSTAARALLDDVKARRESAFSTTTGVSPFPDFDRTLQTLRREDGGGFSFNLDPALAGEDVDQPLPDFEVEASTPFHGSYVEAFPALRPFGSSPTAFMPPPGLPFPNRSIYDPIAVRPLPISALHKPPTGGSPSYMGSFDPFAEVTEVSQAAASSVHQQSFLDDDPSRKVSRFGFARGRQAATSTPSPLPVSSQLNNTNNDNQSFSNSLGGISETLALTPWSIRERQDYGFQPSSAIELPFMQHTQSGLTYLQQQSLSQGLDSGLSEAQLRDFIQSSREKATSTVHQNGLTDQAFSAGQPPFNDPAIMSARFASATAASGHLLHGPPPGLSYPPGSSNVVRPEDAADNARVAVNDHGSAHGSTFIPSFSSSDFPALPATPVDPSPRTREELLITEDANVRQPTDTQEKTDRKTMKKAVDRTAERQKPTHERAAPKGVERMKSTQLKGIGKEKVAAAASNGQSKIVRKQHEMDKTAKDSTTAANAVSEQSTQPREDQPTRTEKQKSSQGRKAPFKPSDNKQVEIPSNTAAKSSLRQFSIPKPSLSSEPLPQVPLLSKKPKKTKPTAKPVKVLKEDMPYPSEASILPASDASLLPTDSSSNNSRSHSLDRNAPTSVEELLEDLDIFNPGMDLPNHPFFDIQKLNPAATMPLEYGPLVHALSALSVGGGSFANNMPSGSIDNAVSSFQQLLETLTQTISDLLRLLPRTTWDDSSSFDGVLRDMLKGDDFLDDAVDEGHGKEDEVAALTLALERRARWMEVQLSKLEELHRDINTAAVRAVLSFNDNGWDRHAFLPRVGNTLRRFDSINIIEEGKVVRSLTADELEQKLAVAKDAAVFAETEIREVMEIIQSIKPTDGT